MAPVPRWATRICLKCLMSHNAVCKLIGRTSTTIWYKIGLGPERRLVYSHGLSWWTQLAVPLRQYERSASYWQRSAIVTHTACHIARRSCMQHIVLANAHTCFQPCTEHYGASREHLPHPITASWGPSSSQSRPLCTDDNVRSRIPNMERQYSKQVT